MPIPSAPPRLPGVSYDIESVGNGERVVPWHPEEMIRQHEVRYRFAAREISDGSRVLECACGSGYGLSFLAERARSVTAVDLSESTIAFAREHFGRPNVEFLVGSAECLPLPSASFDAYVCFETIEHVDHPERLLAEAARVLEPRGLFIVSTPNRVWSGLGPGERPKNPFHKVEWSLTEFDRILRRHFSSIRYLGQRVRSRNKLQPQYVASKLKRALGLVDLVAIGGPGALEPDASWQPENFVAVCRVEP